MVCILPLVLISPNFLSRFWPSRLGLLNTLTAPLQRGKTTANECPGYDTKRSTLARSRIGVHRKTAFMSSPFFSDSFLRVLLVLLGCFLEWEVSDLTAIYLVIEKDNIIQVTTIYVFNSKHKRSESKSLLALCLSCWKVDSATWAQTWIKLIVFHVELIFLGKVWIKIFYRQLWVINRANWTLVMAICPKQRNHWIHLQTWREMDFVKILLVKTLYMITAHATNPSCKTSERILVADRV